MHFPHATEKVCVYRTKETYKFFFSSPFSFCIIKKKKIKEHHTMQEDWSVVSQVCMRENTEKSHLQYVPFYSKYLP